jgi:hypothetical protein
MNPRWMLSAMILVTSILLAPLGQAASYRIVLTNGREVLTSRYWEEGPELRCSVAAGVIGVPKALVKSITAVEASSHVGGTVGESALPTPRADTVPVPGHGSRGTPTAEADPSAGKGAFSADREKKAALMAQLEAARKQHLEASAAKDGAAKQRTLADMRHIAKEIYDLAEEVQAKNKGALPPWWND